MTDSFNIAKAVFFGNSISHFKEVFVSEHQKRYKVLHFSIGLVEALPIIGQIVSLVEAILAYHRKNDRLYFSFKAQQILLPLPQNFSLKTEEQAAVPTPLITQVQHTSNCVQELGLSIQKEESPLEIVAPISEIINPVIDASAELRSTEPSLSDLLRPYGTILNDFELFEEEAKHFLDWAKFLQQQNIPFGNATKPLYDLLIPNKFTRLSEERLLTAISSFDLEQFVLVYEKLGCFQKKSSNNQKACAEQSINWLYDIWCKKIFKIQKIDLSLKSIIKVFDITSGTYKLYLQPVLNFLAYFISPENHKDHLQSLASTITNVHKVLENGEKLVLESKNDSKNLHSWNSTIYRELMNIQRVSKFLHGHFHGFLWMGFLGDMQEWRRPEKFHAINLRQFVEDFQRLRNNGFERGEIVHFRQQFSSYFETDVPDLGSENIRNLCMTLLGIFLDDGAYSPSDPTTHLKKKKAKLVNTLDLLDSYLLSFASSFKTITAKFIEIFLPYEKFISKWMDSIDFPLLGSLKEHLNGFAKNICNGLIDRVIKLIDLKKILTYKSQIKKVFRMKLDVVEAQLALENEGNTDSQLRADLEKKKELLEQGYVEFLPDLLEIIQHHVKILLNDESLRILLKVINIVIDDIGNNRPPAVSEAPLFAYMQKNIFSMLDTLG